jgi:hypothetical protein
MEFCLVGSWSFEITWIKICLNVGLANQQSRQTPIVITATTNLIELQKVI